MAWHCQKTSSSRQFSGGLAGLGWPQLTQLGSHPSVCQISPLSWSGHVLMAVSGIWVNKPSCVKGNQKHVGPCKLFTQHLLTYIPLANTGHVAITVGWRGNGRRLTTKLQGKEYEYREVLIRAVSAINLPPAIFTDCHHLDRSRESLHYFKFSHYQFSFCFSMITSEAGRQSEKNTGFAQWCPLLYPDCTTSGYMTLGKFPCTSVSSL